MKYRWHGQNNQAEISHGEITAPSINLAKLRLSQQGIHVTKIDSLAKSYFAINVKISRRDIIIFIRQLAMLVASQLPLAQAIGLLSQNLQLVKLRNIILNLQKDLNSGNSLSKCLQKHPTLFDSVTCNLIAAGEQSGTLDLMLTRIANHAEKNLRLIGRLKQALIYPMLISLTAIILSLVMLLFIVPKFGELFINNRHPLPYLTLLVINLSSWLHHWIWVLLSLAIAAVTSGYYSYFVWKEKIIFEKILLRLPLLGPILQKICLAHLMRTLGTLFSAGIPITQMLNITIPCLKLFIYRQALQKLHFDISTGKSFSAALGNNPLFPPMLVQMIHVGEQSGTLEAMFEKVCFWYENDIDQWVGNISQLLEPLIIIVLGVLIGGLVIAMYLPIFNLGNAI